MNSARFDGVLAGWEARVRALDDKLSPIANRHVDITTPGWLDALKAQPMPLDEAGVRAEAESVLLEMVHRYQAATAGQRAAVRGIFARFRAFAWAATLAGRVASPDTFREHLIHFSIADQGRDSRDAILWLQEICREAADAGVNGDAILHEVAMLSSDIDKYQDGIDTQPAAQGPLNPGA